MSFKNKRRLLFISREVIKKKSFATAVLFSFFRLRGMGSCVSHAKERYARPLVHSEPDWSAIKSIIVYGVPKDGTSDGLQWEVIVCINIDTHPVYKSDTRSIVMDLLDTKYYSSTHFTHSLFYQLSSVKSGTNVAYFDTMAYLNSGELLPTTSFEQVCTSYIEDIRLLEIKKLCMYETSPQQ